MVIAGFDLGGTTTRIAVRVDGADTLRKFPTRISSSSELVGHLTRTLTETAHSAGVDVSDVRGVGIGMPGSVSADRTTVRLASIAQMPKDIFESAFIDGASHYDAFVKLVLPLAMPAIASFAIFQFLWVWNDLLIALVFLGTGDDVTIVTSRLNELVGTRGQAWHLLTAGAFLTMAIPLLVFLALQRYFVRGMMAGSVKG